MLLSSQHSSEKNAVFVSMCKLIMDESLKCCIMFSFVQFMYYGNGLQERKNTWLWRDYEEMYAYGLLLVPKLEMEFLCKN